MIPCIILSFCLNTAPPANFVDAGGAVFMEAKGRGENFHSPGSQQKKQERGLQAVPDPWLTLYCS